MDGSAHMHWLKSGEAHREGQTHEDVYVSFRATRYEACMVSFFCKNWTIKKLIYVYNVITIRVLQNCSDMPQSKNLQKGER